MSEYDNVIKLRQTNQLKSLYTYVSAPVGTIRRISLICPFFLRFS